MLDVMEAVWEGLRSWADGRPLWRAVAVSLVLTLLVGAALAALWRVRG